MIKDICSKITCMLKSVIGDIKIEKKITDIAAKEADLFEESKNEIESSIKMEPETLTETVAVPISKEPVEINIHNPIYEYAHGKKFSNTPSWIVVHYTACANVGAKSMCNVMKNNTGASSHFYVDEKDIYAAVPLKYIAWHVGDGKCRQPDSKKERSLEELTEYKCKDWRYDLAAANHLKWKKNNDDFKGNSYSIGVDLCVKKKSTKTKKATDTDWYFEDAAVDNMAKLVAYLMKKYNIDIDHVIRHGDATGKLCPTVWVSKYIGDGCDDAWENFLDRASEYMKHEIVANFM